MANWYLKGNARRFYRINMPIKSLILPKSAITHAEIYANGIDYFPPSIEKQLNLEKRSLYSAIDRVKEHKELLTKLFTEVIAYIDFMADLVRDLSQGISPKEDPSYWVNINSYLRGFTLVDSIKASSPKTYEYFKLIEIKYLTFLNALVYSIKHSTPQHFAVEGLLPEGFKIDEMNDIFGGEKFTKIPMIQAIHRLINYLDLVLNIYRQMNNDHYLKNFPQDWPQQLTNISAGGLAIKMQKRFQPHERVSIHIYFPEYSRTLNFEGSVVDIRSLEDEHLERIAINFEFPDGSQQDFLQTQIQLHEIAETFKTPVG